MNFGHGELGFGAWPSAKSIPVAENWTVFRVSTPMALEALAMTALASWADGIPTTRAASASPAKAFLSMVPPPFKERQCSAAAARGQAQASGRCSVQFEHVCTESAGRPFNRNA